MTIVTLISTMHRRDINFLNKMNLQTNAIVVNQMGNIKHSYCSLFEDHLVKIINSQETGLSRSRNRAIKEADADICIIADDDIVYCNNYEKQVELAYKQHPEADIIAFQVDRFGGQRNKKFREHPSWENQFTLFKISSVEITFKRESIEKNGIQFNENIGAGTIFFQGEESVFLSDAFKKGLKILYLPIKIAATDISDSTWFSGYNEKYFESKGVTFFLINKSLFSLLCLQFLIRKRKMYKGHISFLNAYRSMKNGKKKYEGL